MPRRTLRAARHPGRLALLLLIACLLVPTSSVHPVSISLAEVESTKEVDFDGDVVWLLLLGSDARPGTEITDGRTDAIQLVGLDLRSGRAVGLGIPRDSWVYVPGKDPGMDRINNAVSEVGVDGAAEVVADVVGITPDLVLLVGFDGFRDLIQRIGGVEVRSDRSFTDETLGLTVRRGVNSFDGDQALDYTRSRKEFAGPGDFVRSGNQQRVLLGVLRAVLAQEDAPGFMEAGALAALSGLDTDLTPVEIYRLAQAATRIRPERVTSCVLPGSPAELETGASIVVLDRSGVRRVAADARDLRIDRGC